MYCPECGARLANNNGKCIECQADIDALLIDELAQEKTNYIAELDAAKYKNITLFAYLGPLFFIPMMKKESNFATFHARQGMVLFILEVIASLFFLIKSFFFVVGLMLLGVVIYLACVGVVSVIKEKCEPVPFIGKFIVDFFEKRAQKTK